MKTKMIFSIAALLMLGNVCLNAQGNGEGATPTDYSKQYLTFEAIEDGTFSLRRSSLLEGLFEYSIDNGSTWSTLDMNSSTPTILAGNKILWKGRSNIIVGIGTFSSTGRFNVEGNIMSLLYRDDFESATSLPDEEAFEELFGGNTNLVSAENLVLPAATLKEKCYYEMFRGCTSLIKAPKLPATHLESSCYFAMFKGCTSLLTAPELPAKSLSNYCYMQMFEGCTSLIKAPILPALNMYYRCYYNMFKGCTSLSYVKCLATNISTSECTSDWLDGVSSSGTFVKASSMNNDWSRGASGIPNGWTVSNDESVPSTPTDYSKQPFTIVAHNEDVTIRMIASSSESFEDVQFSTDKGQTWSGPGNTDLFYKVIPANTTLSLRGYFIRYLSSLEISGGTFDVEGNIASLRADYEERNKWHTYTGAINLKGLFSGHTNLISAENLILPSTTLVYSCYEGMFKGCTSLTKAPQLPATTLSVDCYRDMFNGCTSLTTAPELLATTLDAESCYDQMFYGCTSLNYVKCLATEIETLYATRQWLYNVSSSGTFVKASSMNSLSRGASGIPSGWTVTNAQTNQTKRTIHVATAGTLPNLISEDEKYEIEELTLTGELNGTDFRFIRDMAGGGIDLDDLWKPVYTDGQLKRLDITDVSIKKGGTFYYYKIVGDNEECYTKDNTLTPFLFGGCRKLSEVRLPNTVTSIDEYAFYECNSLATVTIPNKVEYISNIAFISNSALSVIKVDDGNRVYDSRNNCNAIISTASNKLIIGCKNTTIPNSVTSIGNRAFSGCTGLTSITIPNSVTSIDERAFSNCTGLASITIPNSVTSIGGLAFFGCSGLSSVKIFNSVTFIERDAFSSCSGLTSIKVESGNQTYDSRNNCNAIIEKSTNILIVGCKNTIIPNSVTSIGEQAFRGCTGLSSITIPNSVTSIGNSAFSGCCGLTSITIPRSVTSIGNDAFNDCSGLTSITIPNGVTSIGSYAFTGCSGLTSITIPRSVTSIGNYAFHDCSGLTSITIPNGVTSIGDYAFSGCSSLTSITIPNSVTSIGNYAFYNCSGLTSIISQINNPFEISYSVFSSSYSTATLTVPFGTKSLYEAADGWNKFSKITDSPSLKRTIHVATAGTLPNLISEDEKYEIEELTLTGRINGTDIILLRDMAGIINNRVYTKSEGKLKKLDLSEVTIVSGGHPYEMKINGDWQEIITNDNCLPQYVFYLSVLSEVVIPNSVTSIGSCAFSGCNLTSINIPNSVTSLGDFAFSSGSLTSIKVEDDNPKYDSRNNCNAIIDSNNQLILGCKNTIIPNSVTSIGNNAFDGCKGLTSITIPNSVTSIDNYAFFNCSNLTSIIIPNSVTLIDSHAFGYCNNLTTVTIPNSVTIINAYAFQGCSSLTTITIPNSVTTIDGSAFSGCSGLTSIQVENGNINYDSRNNCNAIIDNNNQLIAGCKNTVIPNSVTSIGYAAFYGCSGLTSINIPQNVTSIGDEAFLRCSSLTSITIPNSVTSIGYRVFDNCKSLASITIPNSVTSIGIYAFFECSNLTSITIPNSVTSIGSLAFYDCKGLKKVISKIEKPFTISSDVFSCIPSDAELIVPAGTKSLYEATEGWNKFSKITTEHLPTLETQPAQPTSTTKARLIALANEEDDEQHFGFEWLRNDAPANMPANKVSAPLYDGRIIGSLGGLNPDIYYKYRPFYKSDSGEMVYGEWIPFITGDANVFFEPEVHTKEAIVSNDGALLSAVFVEGTEDIQEKGFEYWPKNSNARAVSLTRGNNIGSVIVSGNNTSVTIEGLKAGTEYGYRPYVKTASGITYGEEKTFKTSMLGDVNGDNKVDNNDLNDLVSYIMGIIPPHFNKDAADLNNDNKVNAADIVKMVNILK